MSYIVNTLTNDFFLPKSKINCILVCKSEELLFNQMQHRIGIYSKKKCFCLLKMYFFSFQYIIVFRYNSCILVKFPCFCSLDKGNPRENAGITVIAFTTNTPQKIFPGTALRSIKSCICWNSCILFKYIFIYLYLETLNKMWQ